jgi:hypothetical protein
MTINIDILKNILTISSDKYNTLLFFLDDSIKNKLKKYKLIDFKDLYLNDKIILINKSTLDIDIIGNINNIDHKISILKNNRTLHFNPELYYIFCKYNNNKNKDITYFEELLKQLG